MKLQRILAICLVLSLGQQVFAAQGNLQSSSGFVGSTVGGATVAQFTNEFDAVIDNPALMQFTKTAPNTNKFSFGIEYARFPTFLSASEPMGNGTYVQSKFESGWIPFLGYFYHINNRWKFGTGVYVVGGSAWDYSDSIYKTKAIYAVVSMPLALSYKINKKFNLGASLNVILKQMTNDNFGIKSKSGTLVNLSGSVGVSYEVFSSIILGAALDTGATSTFKGMLVTPSSTNDVKIGTPMLISVGIAQNRKGYSIGFKYRTIRWATTENYKQLGWNNQNTISLGGRYNFNKKFIGRAGIYYVTSVYRETTNIDGDKTSTIQGTSAPNYTRDFVNAISYTSPQWNYALGAGYKITLKSILDFGIIYEPATTLKFSGTSRVIGQYEIKKKNSNIGVFLMYSHEL